MSSAWASLCAWAGLGEDLVCREGAHGRGLWSCRDFRTGETVLYLPPNRLITGEGTERALGAFDRWARLSLSVLALQQEHHPWSAMLPTDLRSFPLHYSTVQRAAMRGTSVLDAVLSREQVLHGELAMLGFSVSEERWFAARTLVSSRVFQQDERLVLAPVADLLNHSFTANCDWSLTADGLRVVAITEVRAGAELTLCYGQKSNSRMLLHYGFTDRDNPHHDCVIALPEGAVRVPIGAQIPRDSRALWGDSARRELARPHLGPNAPADAHRAEASERRALSWLAERCLTADEAPAPDS